MNNKKAVLVVSFGTSYPETRKKNIEVLEHAICSAVPDRHFYRAWTSGKIIRKIGKRDGMIVRTVPQALEQMLLMGYQDILVQPTHILNGIENDSMLAEIEKYVDKFEKISVGDPLLTSQADIAKMVKIITKAFKKKLDDETALVMMGHGTEHAANEVYHAMNDGFVAAGHADILLGTVEGEPVIEDVLAKLAEMPEIRKIILTPFMIVAGDHATNDMAGDEEDSWKTLCEKAGYEVTCVLKGLGEYADVAKLFVAHATEE